MLHRLREAWAFHKDPFLGPAVADETWIGGKRRNMSNRKRKALRKAGAGPNVGKTIVAGMKDRATKNVGRMRAVVAGMIGKRLLYRNLVV